MGYERIYGAREALTGKSETLKEAIRAYFEAKGYALHTDSYIEGSHSDLVFHARDPLLKQHRVEVEAKATAFSFGTKEAALAVLQYFQRWLSREPQERFTLWFFIEREEAAQVGRSLFEHHDGTQISAFAEEVMELGRERTLKQTKTVRKELVRFLKTIEVRVGDADAVRTAAAEYEKRSSSSLTQYAERKVLEIQRREEPLAAKSRVTTNLMPLRLPDACLIVRVAASTPPELYAQHPGIDLPPFGWLGDSELLTWNIPEILDVVHKIAAEAPRGVSLENAMHDQPAAARRLLKESVKLHLRAIGLWCHEDRFFAPLYAGKTEWRLTTPSGRARQVVKLMTYQDDDDYHKKGDPNFAVHEAFEAKLLAFEGAFFLSLSPIQYPTKDGSHPIWDGEARARILRAIPDFSQNRNRPQAGWVQFWHDYAFSPAAVAKRFGTEHARPHGVAFGPLIGSDVGWSPQAPPRNVRQLDEFP